MKHFFKLLIITCVLCSGIGTSGLFASEGDAGVAGSYLSWGAGARALAMGRSFVGLSNDASAIYWNPAGLSQLHFNQFTAFHAELFENTQFNFLGYAHPLNETSYLGLGGVMLRSGGYEYRDIYNNVGDTFSMEETAVIFSGSTKLREDLLIGANIKMVNQKIYKYRASGQGADIGVLYLPLNWVSVGANLRNIYAPKIKLKEVEETYPITGYFGTVFKLFEDKLNVAVDLKQAEFQSFKINAGAEYWVSPYAALRGGWNENEIASGIGYIYKDYHLDYAFSSQSMGLSHRLSFSVDFGGSKCGLVAKPKIFSTLGSSEYKETVFKITAWAKYRIETWELLIKDENDRVVKKFSGEYEPPEEIIWNGRDDESLKVNDGVFKCKLMIVDGMGKKYYSATQKVRIITDIPEPEIDVEISY